MTHEILNRDPTDEIFKTLGLFDDDETGKISFKNLKRLVKELSERMTDEELQEMIDEADLDGNGEVNEEEFLRIMKNTNVFRALALKGKKVCTDKVIEMVDGLPGKELADDEWQPQQPRGLQG